MRLLLGAWLMTWSLPAAAQPKPAPQELPVDFAWTAPDACPTRAQVVAELAKAVDAGGKELPSLWARATVQQDGATWRLELETEMDGRHGTRLLEADSCEGLARAATLVLALTLGEGLARRQQAQAEAQSKPPPPPAEPPPEPPPAAVEPPPRAPRFALWANGAVGSDALGGIGPGVGLGLGLAPRGFELGARVGVTLPRTTQLEGSGGEVRSYTAAGELQACWAPVLAPLQLAACASGGLTLLSARGEGTARDREALIPLYQLGANLGLRWLFTERAFLQLGALSRFYLTRPELVVEGLPERRRVEAFSLAAELGAGVRW